jgi:hypothetical protein
MGPLGGLVFIIFVRRIGDTHDPAWAKKRPEIQSDCLSLKSSDNLVDSSDIRHQWLGRGGGTAAELVTDVYLRATLEPVQLAQHASVFSMHCW